MEYLTKGDVEASRDRRVLLRYPDSSRPEDLQEE